MDDFQQQQQQQSGYYGNQYYDNQGGYVDDGFQQSYDVGASSMEQFPQDQQFGQFDYSQPAPDMGGYSQDYGGESAQYSPPSQYTGSIMTPDPVSTSYAAGGEPDNFEDEPPLLEELGINFDHIRQKTIAVLNPLKQPDTGIQQDTDLAGPLVFCLAFGGSLLLTGKVHFGYIYGIGVVGCIAMYMLLNLMSMNGTTVTCVFSVLGYCLLPMVLLSFYAVLLSLQGLVGIILTSSIVLWCSISASKLFVSALGMDQQQMLVAYPCALLYGVFALLTVF